MTEDEGVTEVWNNYFQKLLNEEYDWKREDLGVADPVSGPAERINLEEISVAVDRAKAGKCLRLWVGQDCSGLLTYVIQ